MARFAVALFVALIAYVSAQTIKWDHPSVPAFGQFNRNRASPRNSSIALQPVDGAELLVGQRFDLSIEIDDASATPDASKVSATINDKDIKSYFGREFVKQDWTFSYSTDAAAAANGTKVKVNASRVSLRGVFFNATGTYNLVVSSGSSKLNATWVVRGYAGDKKAKNLVLFIGDGMAPSMISAARYLSRATIFGKFKDNFLAMETLGSIGKVSTNGYDSMLTDSANSAMAYNTGNKGAVNALGSYTDTSASNDDDPKLETLAEILRRERPNMCVGVVTTSEIQDATPAAVWAHTRARGDKANITSQALNGWKLRDNSNWPWDVKAVKPDVLLGGGGEFFVAPNSYVDKDGKQVNYQSFKDAGYTVVNKGSDLKKYNGNGPLLGIFHANHMETWLDRNVFTDNLKTVNSDPTGAKTFNDDQPGLVTMVQVAIKTMDSKCSEGWFLMAEAASVDKAMHPLDFDRALADLIELDAAVKYVADYGKNNSDNTAIIVTADHAQGYDVAGSIDLDLFSSAPSDPTGLNLNKRNAVGVYQNAGWPDAVVDENGLPTKFANARFRFLGSKVDSPGYTEDYRVIRNPQNTTNPLTRNPAITVPKNTTVSIPSKNITIDNLPIAVAVPNIAETSSGIDHPSSLGPADTSSVHTLQAVDIYCKLPGAYQFYCSRPMDNTEVFFIMAEILGLGKGDGSSTASVASVVLPSTVSTGALVGIIIGCIIGGLLLGAAIVYFLFRPKPDAKKEEYSEVAATEA
ncbi:hypothetical protein HK098_006204 [Nowakowskiella sp. JEL0407]|nr:hypothetical protein HK098_006204 [Nowakowskiella sp. JEL0407]